MVPLQVQTCIRNAYLRAAIRRNPNRRSVASLHLSRSSGSSQRRSPLPRRRPTQQSTDGQTKAVIVVTRHSLKRKSSLGTDDPTQIDVLTPTGPTEAVVSRREQRSQSLVTTHLKRCTGSSASVCGKDLRAPGAPGLITNARSDENLDAKCAASHIVLSDGTSLLSRCDPAEFGVASQIAGDRGSSHRGPQIV